jgi:serine/threonine protein phosphatase PrpC
MSAVNDQLVRAAARSLLGDRSGSTVAALLVRGSRCAVLWAGDSRVYRWRSGRLEQLTRDHRVAGSGDAGGADLHAITRAIGAQPRLELDVCRERVRAGDRYLLCSDGLTRTVPEAQMRVHLETPDIGAAVQRLVKATLDAGAPDNVTALIVEAFADGLS